jgi:hypothetical protein
MQWLDIAAVYHAHTGWRGIRGTHLNVLDDDMHTPPFEKLRQLRGDPPPHFEKTDWTALTRYAGDDHASGSTVSLFDVLAGAADERRAFRTREPLPIACLLETMRYAVFGHSWHPTMRWGFSGLKRHEPFPPVRCNPIESLILLAVHGERLQHRRALSHFLKTRRAPHSLALLERMVEAAAAADWRPISPRAGPHFAEAHALVIHSGALPSQLLGSNARPCQGL